MYEFQTSINRYLYMKFIVGRTIKLANVAKISSENQNIKIYLNKWGYGSISKYCLTNIRT